MEISRYIIINIISLIIIRGCNGIQEKEYKNLIDPNAESENYISLNISSYDATNNFHIISSELLSTDTIVFSPKPDVYIGEISDNNISLWKRAENEKFLLGLISSNPNSASFTINLIIKSDNGIRYVMYRHKQEGYEMVAEFQYLDGFSTLKSTDTPEEFSLNLGKTNIPQIVDTNIKIDKYIVNLFIPHKNFRATKVKFGRDILFDGTSDGRHVPIALAYEINAKTYLNMFIAQGNDNFGYIYKYELTGIKFNFLHKSEKLPFYNIFTHQLGSLLYKPQIQDKYTESTNKLKVQRQKKLSVIDSTNNKPQRSDSINEADEIDIPRISVDIANVNSQFIKKEVHKVLNMGTTKYIPVGAIITSVELNGKLIWSSNEEETKCLQINIHSVNDQNQAVELTILKKGATIIRTIPYNSILSDTHYDENTGKPKEFEGKYEFKVEDVVGRVKKEKEEVDNDLENDREEREDKENKVCEQEELEKKGTNTTQDTEVGRPQTPPPSPARRSNLKVVVYKPVPVHPESTSTSKTGTGAESGKQPERGTSEPETGSGTVNETVFEPIKEAETKSETLPNNPGKDGTLEESLKKVLSESPSREDPLRLETKVGTPPNSPARSPKNSLSADEVLSEVDLDKIRINMYKNSYKLIGEHEDDLVGENIDSDDEDDVVDGENGSNKENKENKNDRMSESTRCDSGDDLDNIGHEDDHTYGDKTQTVNGSTLSNEKGLEDVDLVNAVSGVKKENNVKEGKEEVDNDLENDREEREDKEKVRFDDKVENISGKKNGDLESSLVFKGRQYNSDNVLDLSSKESIQRMLVVDGTKYVPFVILFPYDNYPIKSIQDGKQQIWAVSNEDQVLKCVSLYLYQDKPKAMAVMLSEKPEFRYRYYLKDLGEWFEVNENDYIKNTEYEFKKPEEKEDKEGENKEDKEDGETTETTEEGENKESTEVKKENVLHVSIMIPVILGTIFLLLWVGSMLFIIFFV